MFPCPGKMPTGLRAVHTCDFTRCSCHPGVCNKLMTFCAARYPLMIRCSLSLTPSPVKHTLQDVNLKGQNRTCKQAFRKEEGEKLE